MDFPYPMSSFPNLGLLVGIIGLDKKKMSVKLSIFSFPPVLTYVLGAQKKRLIETVLLSTHNIQ